MPDKHPQLSPVAAGGSPAAQTTRPPSGGNDNARRQAGRPSPREFWRSLEELEQSPDFVERLHREFPRFADCWHDGLDRRRFLELMGASFALAGLAGCGSEPPRGQLVPYLETPEEMVQGKPLLFATAMTLGGYALGLLVESHMGRPTKVEGNPDHPASLGATDVFAQASVLSLYGPDRAQTVRRQGQISNWDEFLDELSTRLLVERGRRGAGLRLLTETVTSPTLAAQIERLLEQFPEARWHQYEPVHRDNARAGAIAAFGEDVETLYRFDRADVILALDDDFLATGPAHVRCARDFARRRSLERVELNPQPGLRMNRLYVVESAMTLTGAAADHRLPVRPPAVEAFARLIALGLELDVEPPAEADRAGIPDEWLEVVVSDLRGADRGGDSSTSLVVAGVSQPPIVHALAHAINAALGSAGNTVEYIKPVSATPVFHQESLAVLADDLQSGAVETLVILGGNPVFTAPAGMDLAQLIRENVRLSVHFSESEDETSAVCRWHVPQAHFLESWSDARAFDGTVTICQPLIAPLYGGRTSHELLSTLLGEPERGSYDILREGWEGTYQGDDFELFWRRALHDGVVAGTASEPISPSLAADWSSRLNQTVATGGSPAAGTRGEPARGANNNTGRQAGRPSPRDNANTFFVAFRPDPHLWDGRFADNAWLQELPRPLTKVSWDNPAQIGPADAQRLGLKNGDVVELKHGTHRLSVPVWILPGQPAGVVTVHFGPGRERVGHVGRGAGFNGYRLRTAEGAWSIAGVELRPTGERYPLVSTQHHHLMEGRELVRAGTLAELERHPDDPPFMHAGHQPPPDASFYPEWPDDGYQWGMAIDQTTCIGCQACVIACQAENNIPVVGKDQVERNREMHWLRIDTYYQGPVDNPQTYHQPMMCVHCEKAPCEVVCPVVATTHSSEGLNEMTYNRCIGTRYCSNNCPYKVRRFNFLDYRRDDPPTLRLLHNPDVTVRSRGVMEKCTYCVQRINSARIDAEKAGRRIRDGDLETACQAVCPSQAIVFGNIKDPDARVTRLKQTPLSYGVLAELNTRPRTSHLAAIRNPHPRLERTSETHDDRLRNVE